MMKDKLSIILLAAYSLLLVGIGFWIGSGDVPAPAQGVLNKMDVNQVMPDLEAPSSVPTVRFQYITLRDTVETLRDTTIYVPKYLARFNIAPKDPVRVKPSSVTYKYYNPDQSRWMEDKFEVPDRMFAFNIGALSYYDFYNGAIYAGFTAEARIKNITAFGTGLLSPDNSPITAAGVKINIIGKQ